MNDEIRRLEAIVEGASGAMAFPVLAEAHRRAGRPEEAERVAREGLANAPHVTAGRVALALALLDQKRGDEAKRELERLLGGGGEHALAADAVAATSGLVEIETEAEREPGPEPAIEPERSPEPPRPRGELATLDPYPDHAFGAAAPDEPLPADETHPPIALEPADAGPFGSPPARGESLVFDETGVGDEELDSAFDAAETNPEEMIGADDVAQAALDAVPEDVEGDEDDDGAAIVSDPASPFATETMAGLLERQGHGDAAERVRSAIVPAREPEPAPAAETDEPEPEPDAATAAPEPGGHAHRATLERWLDNLRRDRE